MVEETPETREALRRRVPQIPRPASPLMAGPASSRLAGPAGPREAAETALAPGKLAARPQPVGRTELVRGGNDRRVLRSGDGPCPPVPGAGNGGKPRRGAGDHTAPSPGGCGLEQFIFNT